VHPLLFGPDLADLLQAARVAAVADASAPELPFGQMRQPRHAHPQSGGRGRNAKSKIARGVAPGPMELLALQCEAARSPSGARRNGRHGATVGRWNARKSAQFSRGGLRGYAWVGQRRRNARTKLKRGLKPSPGNWRRWTATLNGERGPSEIMFSHDLGRFDPFAAPSE
jgi:hypothetical protein